MKTRKNKMQNAPLTKLNVNKLSAKWLTVAQQTIHLDNLSFINSIYSNLSTAKKLKRAEKKGVPHLGVPHCHNWLIIHVVRVCRLAPILAHFRQGLMSLTRSRNLRVLLCIRMEKFPAMPVFLIDLQGFQFF